jgi:hypothetical protein
MGEPDDVIRYEADPEGPEGWEDNDGPFPTCLICDRWFCECE